MKRFRTSPAVLAALLLSVLLCLAFYDVVVGGHTFKVTTANSQAMPTGVYGQENNKPPFIPVNGTDTPVLEEPIYEFVRQSLRQGILPLWNPHQACGYALIGMIQAALFYPLNLILYLLPSFYSWDIFILVRLFLAGLFTYGLMKTFRFKEIPALTAAVIFMLSGPLVLLQYWTTNVDLLLPLLLLCFERLIRMPDLRRCAWLGLVMGLTILGGHPEHIFLVNAYGAIFFLFRAVSLQGLKGTLRLIPLVGAAGLLAAGIAAVALFPFLRNFPTEFWHGHPAGTGLLMEEQRERIITLLLPHFFQKAPITYDWTFAGWWGGYLGLLPVSLAVLGLIHRQRHNLNRFFGIMAFVIIAKEYGLPVINWLGALPLFSLVRYAIHTPPLAAFSVAILAGMGTRAVMSRKPLLKTAVLWALSVAAAVMINLVIVRHAPHWSLSIKAAGFAAGLMTIFIVLLIIKKSRRLSGTITGVVILILVFLELTAYIHRQRPRRFDSFPEVPYLSLLKSAQAPVRSYGNFWAFYPNTATGYGVDDLGFFMGLAPARFVRFVNTILSPDLFQNNFRSPALRCLPLIGREAFLDLLNVRYLILPGDDRFIRAFSHFGDYTAGLKQVYAHEVRVYERPQALPRAFLVYHTIIEQDPQKTLWKLKDLGSALRQTAIVNIPGEAPTTLPQMDAPADGLSWVNVERYAPNDVVLRVLTPAPGLLVLSDAYHPDWTAAIDGNPAPVYQTDYLLRGVFVPAGQHKVIFKFRPVGFLIGLWVSGVAVLILASLLMISTKHRS